jgi:TolB-like protein/Flp pilus assembly protein TadD
LNSRPRAYESPALPLSYPGAAKRFDGSPVHVNVRPASFGPSTLSGGRSSINNSSGAMSELNPDPRLEIAHVLFIDIVGSSRLLINEQSEVLRRLNEIVRNSGQVRAAEAAGKLIRLPTGDGMALAFFSTPDAPVRCAVEITKALSDHPNLPLRMGIHSGPVDEIVDVNERSNIAGAGITIAQRVMDCGDAGHILLSERIAGDLAQYGSWRPYLHDLGQSEVKHGVKIGIVNFYLGDIGNSADPEKLKKEARSAAGTRVPKATWQKPALVAAALLCAGVVFLFYTQHRPKQESTASGSVNGVKRMAVLPFKPLTPENRDQVLELGMADTLIAKLSNSREIIISSLPSVRKYGGLDQDPVAAGRELQVDSVLDGNVQRSGDQIRVTARLINVADGSSVWAGTFDEKFTGVFAVQDAISQKVANALALRLSGEEKQRLTRRYTENVAAYELYLTGRYHWAQLTPPDIRKAIGFFQQAIELDPTYALAYFGLAEANRSLSINADVPSRDCLPQAKAAASKALQIDELLAEAHASLSFSLIWYDWDWAGGEKEAKRAIALNPNSAHAHFAYAHVLSDLGRHDEAIAEIVQARKLDPVFLLYAALEGMFFHHAGRNDEASAKLQKVIELAPNFWVTHLILGKVYTQQRKYPEAIAEFTKAKELSHGNSEAIGSIGYVEAVMGDKVKAGTVLEELKNLSSQHYIPPYNMALVHAALGEQNEALTMLERGCDEHDVRVTLLKVDPRWDSLRGNARFVAMLKRIGLN